MKKKLLLMIAMLIIALPIFAMTASKITYVIIEGVGFPTQPPAQITANAGDDVTITVNALTDCGEQYFFQWYFNNEPIDGGNEEILFLENIASEWAGFYQLYVFMDGEEGWSTECELIIYSTLKIIEPHPWTQTKYVGDDVSFVVHFTGGTGPWTVDWRKDGVSLGAPNSTTLSLTNVQLTDAGQYNAIISDSLGATAQSMSATLTVLPASTPPPQFLLDYSGSNSYDLSLNPNGASLASILSDPTDLPATCDYSNINGIRVFHRLYSGPWTVFEDHLWSGVSANSESPAVTFTGTGIDWGNNSVSFAIAGNIFDIQYAISTDMTGNDWFWINIDAVETWINSATLAPINDGMFVIDLSPAK